MASTWNNHKVVLACASAAASIGVIVMFLRKRSEQESLSKRKLQVRCLVTGFNDWRNMTCFQDIWRSEENPSSRVIIGPACKIPPLEKNGPLVKYLTKGVFSSSHFEINWSFVTIPTLWSTSRCLDLFFYDVVIHLGLGVYDSNKKILLEHGAYNGRLAAADASGNMPPNTIIDQKSGEVLDVSESRQEIIESFEDLDLPNGFKVNIARARKENTYICNETHFNSIKAVKQSDENLKMLSEGSSASSFRLRNSFFIHIPYPEHEGNYDELAGAVGKLIQLLIEKSLELKR
jgi:hypothetical protein